MVKIRLTRTGAKNNPHYRVVVANARSKRDGKAIEIIGWYNPQQNPPEIKINKERYAYWLSCGAQPSETVLRLARK
jgi:small subunit ribosomal protein S16